MVQTRHLLQRDRLSPTSHLGTAAKGGFWNPILCSLPDPQLPVNLPKGMDTAHSLFLHGCQQLHFFLLTQPLDFSRL